MGFIQTKTNNRKNAVLKRNILKNYFSDNVHLQHETKPHLKITYI